MRSLIFCPYIYFTKLERRDGQMRDVGPSPLCRIRISTWTASQESSDALVRPKEHIGGAL